ncbi:MAG: C40 family peptidase [Bryobacterales bacterium]|nr:C40 family peptidase [Bryobacterales bacterium]
MLFSVAAFLLMAGSDGVILRPVANMYSKPTEDADVVSQAIYGAPVSIVEQQSGWLRIRTADDYLGWVPAAAVKPGAYANSQRAVMVESLMAHLYRTPSVTKHAPLLTVPYETRLEVVSEPQDDNRRWIQVRLPDDRAAYVQRGDVTFDVKTLAVPEMIALAKRFLGLPYTWGGTSSFGYDCSGYTQMLCRRMGKQLPRDAGPQAHWSGVLTITKEELAPGDLLYFGPSEKRITHTGMYIGDGEFIHASTNTNPVVQISRLADEHWTKILVGCRRLK